MYNEKIIKKILKGKILLWENQHRLRVMDIKELWNTYIPNPYKDYGIDIIR